MSSKNTFSIAVCTVSCRNFEKGNIYPLVGDNNGLHLIYSGEDGEPQELVLHNYGLYELREPCEEESPVFEYFHSGEFQIKKAKHEEPPENLIQILRWKLHRIFRKKRNHNG